MRLIATRLGLAEMKVLTLRPPIHEALRVSIHYEKGDAPDSVATLERGRGDACRLQVVYDKVARPAVLEYAIDLPRYQRLLANLRQTGFDKLDDEDDVPFVGVDLWLVERAAGSFYHDVVISPEHAQGKHAEVVRLLREYLMEAVRKGAG